MTDVHKIAAVLAEIAETHGVTVEEMRGKSKCREFVEARILVARELFQLGLTHREIGGVLKKHPKAITWYLRKPWTP